MSGIHFLLGSFFIFCAIVAYGAARGVTRRLTKLIFSISLGIILLALLPALEFGAYSVVGWLPGLLLWVIIPVFYITLLIILFSKPQEVEDVEEKGDKGFLFN